jgi:diguanylate cyclase (GGDEF)-like protein/PAS domain S-box-containing protein
LAEALPLGILSADARGNVVFCNEAAQQIFNLPADHLMRRRWEKAVHGEDRSDVASAAGAVVRTGVPHQVTFRVETGLFLRWAHAKFVPLGAVDQPTGWIATIEDITDRRRTESRLAHQATHDPLTGLPNRMLLEDRLHQALGRLRRDSEAVTVLFVDLDRFKEVNDDLGHAAGDEVLVEVARRLISVVRDVDTVARLGGDEFVVLCENLPVGDEQIVVGRVHAALEVPQLVRGRQVVVGASVGVARTDATSARSDLITLADRDMYRVKAERRASG